MFFHRLSYIAELILLALDVTSVPLRTGDEERIAASPFQHGDSGHFNTSPSYQWGVTHTPNSPSHRLETEDIITSPSNHGNTRHVTTFISQRVVTEYFKSLVRLKDAAQSMASQSFGGQHVTFPPRHGDAENTRTSSHYHGDSGKVINSVSLHQDKRHIKSAPLQNDKDLHFNRKTFTRAVLKPHLVRTTHINVSNATVGGFTTACPEMCTCSKTVANCSSHYGRLTYVPALPTKITSLIFSRNNLISISNDDFFSNVTNITELDLSRNGLTFVSNGAFKLFGRLIILSLCDNNITSDILQLVFSVHTLRRLSLNSSNLGPWINEVIFLHPHPNIEHFEMYNNKYIVLNFTAFSAWRNLGGLGLGDCDISSIIPDNMMFLRYINLYRNAILDFPETCRDGTSLFPNLTSLFLNVNDISDIHDVCLPSLKTLDLSSNRFVRIKSFTFNANRFPNLTRLILDNSVRTLKSLMLDANAFSNPTLEVIALVDCEISFGNDKSVDADAFANCPSLHELQLNNNLFRGATDEKIFKLFANHSSLKKLFLGYCEINTITENTFKFLSSIQELYIYGNSLTSIPDGAFDNMSNLTVLGLGENKLLSIRETTFNSATRQRLRHLNLADNPFVCSCEIKWFQHWFISDNELFNKISNYQCNNLPNTSLADFYLPDQACFLSSDAFTLTVVCVSLVLITLTVTAMFYRLRWHIRLFLYEAFRGRTGYRQHYLTTANFPYDVFVSYASEDLDWIREHLMPELEERMGLRLCIHQRDFLPGGNIVDNISDNLDKSKKVLMVFSTHFARSQWCQFELALCLQHVMSHDDFLVIVCLEHLPNRVLTGAMLAVLKITTYIQWENCGDARASFCGRLKIAFNEIIA